MFYEIFSLLLLSLQLDEDQRAALDLALQGHNLAVIGRAGSGKSHFIKQLVGMLRRAGKVVGVTASTGMAALHLHGLEAQTIHSFSGILDGRFGPQELERRLLTDESTTHLRRCIARTDVVVLDEASLISARIFEQVEHSLRICKGSAQLFGGVQMVVVLDPRQLPPVPDPLYQDEGSFCFESELWRLGITHKIFFRTAHRQRDQQLLQLVEEAFSGAISQEGRHLLQWLSRPLEQHMRELAITICADNFSVDRHNSAALHRLPGPMTTFRAEDAGDAGHISRIRAPKVLALKEGCRVMLLKNISQAKGLVNGSQGTVADIARDSVTVTFGSRRLQLGRESFTRYSPATQRTVASRLQFPLCLAYALTYHKAQGQELQAVEVDAKGTFKSGTHNTSTTHLCGIMWPQRNVTYYTNFN